MSETGENDAGVDASGGRWPTFAAPAAAAVVLVVGLAFLMLRPAGDDELTAEGRDSDRATVADTAPETAPASEPRTSEPDVSVTQPPTTPRPTPPPLMEPPAETTATETTTAGTTAPTTATQTTTPTTVPAPIDPGPTTAEVRGALMVAADLAHPDWTDDTPPESTSPCGDNPDEASVVEQETAYFARVQHDRVAVRQIAHTLYSFPDETTAARAFDADVELLRACSGKTIDVDGTSYLLSVELSDFPPDQVEAFPCADANVLSISQLTNDDALVPFIAEATASFRCGRNVTVVSFATTVDLDDLQDEDYFSAVAATNIRASMLPGS